jgi:hypothetical protein
MLLTRDYLKAQPWDALIACINAEYGTELQSYSTALESLEAVSGTRTKVVIVPNQADTDTNTSKPIERAEYFYDRLDLTTFFSGQTVKSLEGFTLPTDTFSVLEAVGEFNDIEFTLNDFMHYQYNAFEEVFTLTANPKSLRFVGSLQFKLVNTNKRQLQNLGNKLEFPKANDWPVGTDGTKMAGQYLTSGYDFTSARDVLKNITKDSVYPTGAQLAALLTDVTGDEWNCATVGATRNIAFDAFNGEGRLRMIYNGRCLPRYTPRTDMLKVLVLELSDLSTDVDGYLLMHYN